MKCLRMNNDSILTKSVIAILYERLLLQEVKLQNPLFLHFYLKYYLKLIKRLTVPLHFLCFLIIINSLI